MFKARIIPCLQLLNESLVKTIKFNTYNYIGDPCNTVRIFNELEVDELCFLDIRASLEGRNPNLKVLRDIANECFMPLSYGGGIKDFDTAKAVLSLGFEKLVINTHATIKDKTFITKLAEHFGNQAIIGSVDVKKNIWGKNYVITKDGTLKTSLDPVEWAQELVRLGAGELLITSIDREGTWEGFDVELIKKITDQVSVPVIANGGCGTTEHMRSVIHEGGASAVGVGSMVVFQKKGMGVLINFPDQTELDNLT